MTKRLVPLREIIDDAEDRGLDLDQVLINPDEIIELAGEQAKEEADEQD